MGYQEVGVSVTLRGAQDDWQRSRSQSPSEHTETTPLLRPDSTHSDADEPVVEDHAWFKTPKSIDYLVLAVVLLTSCGYVIAQSPQQRILEAIICYRHYETVDPSKILLPRSKAGPGAIGGVDEMYCKIDEVQSYLAMIEGYQNLFDQLPALVLAIPFGWIADRYGRRIVLLLGIFGIPACQGWVQLVTWFWQAFDVRATWVSSALTIFGGGSSVMTALLCVVIADVSPEGERAAAFLRVAAANLAAALLMPPIAALAMDLNPWIPNLAGTVLELAAAVILLPLPETLNYNQRRTASPITEAVVPELPLTTDSTVFGLSQVKAVLAFAMNDVRVPLIIVTFVGHLLMGASGSLLLQYVSKRYAMTFSKATLLLTIRAAVHMVLLLAILPYLSHLAMKKWNMSSQRKDLQLARLSVAFAAVGWYLVGFAPEIVSFIFAVTIQSLGVGMYMLIRAFLTSLVPADKLAKVFSAISLVDTIGMFGSPVLAALFKRGLSIGGAWEGLPFFFLGLLSTAITFVWMWIGLRKCEDECRSEIATEQ